MVSQATLRMLGNLNSHNQTRNLRINPCMMMFRISKFNISKPSTPSPPRARIRVPGLPEMISGAKYSWVPTNDIDRTSVGSTTSSGMDAGDTTESARVDIFRRSVDLRNRWLTMGTHDCRATELGSTHDSNECRRSVLDESDESVGEMTRVGLTEQRNDRSKSESMMWPSSRTRTFSGFRSLYTTPIMWRYSRASKISAA